MLYLTSTKPTKKLVNSIIELYGSYNRTRECWSLGLFDSDDDDHFDYDSVTCRIFTSTGGDIDLSEQEMFYCSDKKNHNEPIIVTFDELYEKIKLDLSLLNL